MERTRPPVSIRPLVPGDSLEHITALLHRAYRPLLDAGLRYLATHQDATTTAHRIADAECYVAEDKGRTVGTVTLVYPGKPEGCDYFVRPGVASFHQFAVEPAEQGRGIGSAMMDFIERRAAELGATEMALDTAEDAAHLIALYEKRGYKTVGRIDWEMTNYKSVIMAKAL